MASAEPLLPDGQEDGVKGWCRRACTSLAKGLALVLAVVFVLVWIVQAIVWEYATIGCSPDRLEDYDYPGGGEDDAGGKKFNLVPMISLLAERKPMWYGDAFDVIPSNEASTVAGAPVGTWWRTTGPLFNTYMYEDVANSQPTVMMRRKLIRLGQCHVIERCDGSGDAYTISEGANYFANRFRKWLGMTQAMSYKIYKGDTLVAVAEETQNGFESISFRNITSRRELASSVLEGRHFHGQYDIWLVDAQKKDADLPAYVSSAATLLYAFFVMHQRGHKIKVDPNGPEGHGSHDGPSLLAATVENVTVANVPSEIVGSGLRAETENRVPDQLI